MKRYIFYLTIAIIHSLSAQNKQYNPHHLSSHGYLRTGLGRSLSGGEMVQFQAPETTYKSRFGNEANHYSEIQFNYLYQEQNSTSSYEIVYMATAYLEYASVKNAQPIQPETAQLYFKWNNIFNDIDIWVGKRYFQRINVDILDNFWLNPAQNADVGVGVEHISVTNRSFIDISLLRFSKELEAIGVKGKNLENHKVDIRWQNIPLTLNSSLNLLLQLSHRPKMESSVQQYQKEVYGFSVGAWQEFQKGKFYHRLAGIFRKGSSMIENPYSGRNFLEVNQQGQQLYNLAKAYDIQCTADFRYDDFVSNGFLGVIAYQYKNFGIETVKNNSKVMQHLNVTGRYSRYISDTFRLTLDTAFDRVNITDGSSGNIFKVTLSPELNWKKGMMSRPSLRPFITYATWSSSLKGEVGVFNDNPVYANSTSGFTTGIQVELWW